MKPTAGKEQMTFDEWLLYGVTRNWTTAPICQTHDGFAKTHEEEATNNCVHYMRLYKSSRDMEKLIEEFPPATWRSHTRNLEWED